MFPKMLFSLSLPIKIYLYTRHCSYIYISLVFIGILFFFFYYFFFGKTNRIYRPPPPLPSKQRKTLEFKVVLEFVLPKQCQRLLLYWCVCVFSSNLDCFFLTVRSPSIYTCQSLTSYIYISFFFFMEYSFFFFFFF